MFGRKRRRPGTLGLLDELGFRRATRLLIALSIPPLWYEIVLLHFRGSFHNRYMWIPVSYLPVEFVSALLAAASDRHRSLFRAISFGTVAVGALGTLMHVLGVRKQMGGLYNWRYNLETGPPVPAPPQVAFFGLLGALSASPRTHLVNSARVLDALSQPFLAAEAGYAHRLNYYANPIQYTPVTLAPALGVVQLAAASRDGTVRDLARMLELPLAAVATLAGFVGFGFHLRNVARRSGGVSFQNLFYGPPVVAPLQLTGQGALALLAAYFDEGSR